MSRLDLGHGGLRCSGGFLQCKQRPAGLLHAQLLAAVWRAKVFAKYQGELVGLLQAPELVHFALSANQFSSWVNKAQACRECSCNGEPWSLRIALHRFASLRGVAVLLLALGSGSAGSGFASILGA